jgi:hypothetical protein
MNNVPVPFVAAECAIAEAEVRVNVLDVVIVVAVVDIVSVALLD